MKKETKTQELYRALYDLHAAAYHHIMRLGVKNGFHEMVRLEQANQVLRKYKVMS